MVENLQSNYEENGRIESETSITSKRYLVLETGENLISLNFPNIWGFMS